MRTDFLAVVIKKASVKPEWCLTCAQVNNNKISISDSLFDGVAVIRVTQRIRVLTPIRVHDLFA